jgi:signal transduction histidine kinase
MVIGRSQITVDRRDGEHELRAIHARFARNVLGIHVAVSIVALAALVVALVSDLQYQRTGARDALIVETELRAQYLARYLGLLSDEVRRVGGLPEINLLDHELEPERTLLDSLRGESTIFKKGIALLDDKGSIIWSTPTGFLDEAMRPVPLTSLASLQKIDGVQIVPSDAETGVLFVASPIRRQNRFTGVLLVAIDLAAAPAVDIGFGRRAGVQIALARRDGHLLFPAPGQADARLAALSSTAVNADRGFLFDTANPTSLVVAGAPVPNTDFFLVSAAESAALFGPAWQRLVERLGIGLALAALPIIGFSVLLRGSLRRFQVTEEEAVRAERMRSLGEAASLIAHEVRNSLNSLGVGLDIVLSGEGADRTGRRAEILERLRGEMRRLSEFTTELLTFSRGVVPHVVPLELSGFAEKVVASVRAHAEDRGVRVDVQPSVEPLPVKADPTLIRVVLTNLIGNAIDFAGADRATPHVRIVAGASNGACFIRVIDNGAGIAEAVRSRLFEPFVTGRSNGVGIGLALSKRIARAHGGDLLFHDKMASTCFELTLPGGSP